MKQKRVITVVLMVAMMVACFATVSFAGSNTKRMTDYDVVKSGSFVYCAGRRGIYRVNIKNGTKKKLSSNQVRTGLHIHKGYLYYITGSRENAHMRSQLRRIRLSNGKDSRVYKYKDSDFYYAIDKKKSKIYIEGYNPRGAKFKRVMSLSGKNVSASRVSVAVKTNKTNAKGYAIIYKGDYYVTVYLKTPKKKIMIDKGYRYW